MYRDSCTQKYGSAYSAHGTRSFQELQIHGWNLFFESAFRGGDHEIISVKAYRKTF